MIGGIAPGVDQWNLRLRDFQSLLFVSDLVLFFLSFQSHWGFLADSRSEVWAHRRGVVWRVHLLHQTLHPTSIHRDIFTINNIAPAILGMPHSDLGQFRLLFH